MESSRIKQRRRRHSAQLKARVLAACSEPGASVAQIALAHGLNANLVHKWRRTAVPAKSRSSINLPATLTCNDFVPVPILPPNDIRVSIRRGNAAIDVQWPVSAADHCATWLTRLLR